MRRSIKFLLAAAAAAVPTLASAQVVLVGTFDAAGAARLTKVGSTFPISFQSVFAVPSLTGIFSSIPIGATGTAQNVSVQSGAYSISNFIQIAGYTFSLTDIAPGSFGPAACGVSVAVSGQSCSPAGTGWNFTNLSNGKGDLNLSMSFSFGGTVTTPTSQTFDYTGVFTSQLTKMTYQKLFTKLATAGSSQAISYSLNDVATATVPEPSTITLMAGGVLALLGFGYVRRRQA
jgi:hypothetical protein